MENSNDNRPHSGIDRRVVLGLLALFFGAMLMASNMGMLPYRTRSIILSWEMLLIVIGIIQVISNRENPIGFILIAIGGFFILPDIFDLSRDFHRMFWPVMLIVGGLLVILYSGKRKPFDSGSRHGYRNKSREGKDFNIHGYVDELNVFGGSKKKFTTKDFQGGKVTNIFGGAEIDLTQAELRDGTNYLEVVTIFGGASLIVPSDWNIEVNVVSIFGEFKDKRSLIKKPDDTKGRLVIKGLALFGGGDIKSFA